MKGHFGHSVPTPLAKIRVSRTLHRVSRTLHRVARTLHRVARTLHRGQQNPAQGRHENSGSAGPCTGSPVQGPRTRAIAHYWLRHLACHLLGWAVVTILYNRSYSHFMKSHFGHLVPTPLAKIRVSRTLHRVARTLHRVLRP
ncbi:hypothetical protein HaLaN_32047 [Haematococcus lacustris]|uniref:Uncharacterized protein n=1 Tax=Haematococcus lacustris TaxID=44745 RepID=A0A6A0AIN3_HAELA|nr:hypothetical protein HaLaN_32047 [Haematococcus lacustris]